MCICHVVPCHNWLSCIVSNDCHLLVSAVSNLSFWVVGQIWMRRLLECKTPVLALPYMSRPSSHSSLVVAIDVKTIIKLGFMKCLNVKRNVFYDIFWHDSCYWNVHELVSGHFPPGHFPPVIYAPVISSLGYFPPRISLPPPPIFIMNIETQIMFNEFILYIYLYAFI